MKLKYQQGGALSLPFAVFQPFVLPSQQPQAQKESKTSSKKGSDLIDFMDKILGNLQGLPGDKQAMIGTLTSIFSNMEYKLNNPEMFGGTGSIASEYLQALNYVSNLRFQHDAFIKAKETATNKGSLHEVAINSTGHIIAKTEDGFEWITPEQYAKNQDLYRPITNSELLTLRAKGEDGLVFNQDVIDMVANGMGIKEVTDMVQDAVTNLGNDSQTKRGYVGVKAGELIQGLEDYTRALKNSGKYNATIEDLYEAKLLSESQAAQADMAMAYIYSTLPATAKSLLKMKSNGDDSGAKSLIGLLVTSKLKSKNEFEPKLVGGPTSKHTDAKEQKTSIEDSFLWRVQQNIGTHYGSMKVNNESASALTLRGTIFEQVLTPDNEHIGDNSVENMLNNSHLRSITIGKAYFGNQVLSENDMKKVMYKGDGLMRTNLPVNDDGKPAFELLDLWESLKLDADLTKTPAKDLLATDKYKKLRQYFNNDGSWNKNKVKPFIVFNGMTTDGLINIEPKNKFVVDKDTSADMVGRLKLGLATKVGSDMTYPDIDEQNWYEPFSIQYDHVYEGTIYMPIHMNKNSSILNQGVDLGIAYSIEEEYQDSLKPDYQATNINMLK